MPPFRALPVFRAEWLIRRLRLSTFRRSRQIGCALLAYRRFEFVISAMKHHRSWPLSYQIIIDPYSLRLLRLHSHAFTAAPTHPIAPSITLSILVSPRCQAV